MGVRGRSGCKSRRVHSPKPILPPVQGKPWLRASESHLRWEGERAPFALQSSLLKRGVMLPPPRSLAGKIKQSRQELPSLESGTPFVGRRLRTRTGQPAAPFRDNPRPVKRARGDAAVPRSARKWVTAPRASAKPGSPSAALLPEAGESSSLRAGRETEAGRAHSPKTSHPAQRLGLQRLPARRKEQGSAGASADTPGSRPA